MRLWTSKVLSWCLVHICFSWVKQLAYFMHNLGKIWLSPLWVLIFSCFRLLGGSPKWGLIVEVGQWKPTIFKGKKWVWAKTLSHSQPMHKSSFEMKILGTKPPSWAWGTTNVPCLLSSTHGLGSYKGSDRNQHIPSKPHFLNFP